MVLGTPMMGMPFLASPAAILREPSPPPVLIARRSFRGTTPLSLTDDIAAGRTRPRRRGASSLEQGEHLLEGGGVAAAEQLVDRHLGAGEEGARALHAVEPDRPVL